MKAFERFPKKVKTLKTIAIESVLKPESKQKKKFSGLKKNQQIVCFAETFALFSQRVYPNHVFFIFWKTQKYIILVGKLTFLKSKNIVFKNYA